jgi:DNA-binding NtrC family response regulator
VASLRVLVVEDDDDWREIIRYQFQSRGCTVSTATNFSIAEERLGSETFDIVTLDMWLTSKEQELGNVAISGGWRLLERLARQYPDTSVFVISGGFGDNPERAFQQSRYGVRDFATKATFELNKIDEWIRLAHEAKPPRRGSEAPYPMI